MWELLFSESFLDAAKFIAGIALIALSLRYGARRKATPSDGIDEIDLLRGADRGLPDELKPEQARLVLTEGVDPRDRSKRRQVFYCNDPVPLNGVPDELYQLRGNGLLVPVDTKPMGPRDRVWLSEKIQLSAYKVILERGSGARVADYGYIRRADNAGNAFFVRTDLFTESEVVEFYLRYELLAAGDRYAAMPADNLAFCRNCAHAAQCPHQTV